jgi:hypothetical protein
MAGATNGLFQLHMFNGDRAYKGSSTLLPISRDRVIWAEYARRQMCRLLGPEVGVAGVNP